MEGNLYKTEKKTMNILKRFKDLYHSTTAKDTVVVAFGNAISAGVAIITTIIVARALGPENWGIVAAFLSLVTILVSFEDMGFGASLFRYVARAFNQDKFENAAQILRIVFSIRFVSAVLFAIVLSVSAPFSAELVFRFQEPRFIWFAALCIFSYSLLDFQIAALQSEQKWKTSAFFIGLTNTLRLLLVLLLPQSLKSNVLAILAVYAISPFLSLFLTFFFIRIKLEFHHFRSAKLKEMARFAGWLGLNRILGVTAARADVLLLFYLTSAFNTGIFGAAKQLAIGIPIIIGSFATVIAPRFSSLEGPHLWKYFQKTTTLSVLLSMLIFFGLFLVDPIVNLFGGEYTTARNVLKWLVVSYIPVALSTPAVNLLIYALKKPNIIATITFVQLPLSLAANFYLIPRYGIYGPVIVQNVLNLSTLVVVSFLVWRYRNHKPKD